MDGTLVVAALGLVTTLVGTLVGTLAGPYLADKRAVRKENRSLVKSQRRDPYIDFAVWVEKLQRSADQALATNKGELPLEWLDEMEYVRARIDIVGSYQARVWAYRCRLSFDEIAKAMHAADSDSASYFREKLHDARSAFVRNIRHELEVSSIIGHKVVPGVGDRLIEADYLLPQKLVTNDGHMRWLAEPPESVGETPGAFAVQQVRYIVQVVADEAAGPSEAGAEDLRPA